MDLAIYWCGRLVDAVLWPFDLLPEWLGLALFSALSGIGILWVFGRLTNQARLQRARDQMAAAVYEIRIFFDSPVRIVRAQARLVYGSILYTLFTIPSILVLSAPLALFWVHLDARHGLLPLDPQSSLVVRMVLAPQVDPHSVHITNDEGITTTAPQLFVPSTRELWTRLAAPGAAHQLKVQAGSEVVTKELSMTPGNRFVSAERGGGWSALVALGHEPPIPSSAGIQDISVTHAPRSVRILFSAPWWVHWLLISTLFALLARKRLGVVI